MARPFRLRIFAGRFCPRKQAFPLARATTARAKGRPGGLPHRRDPAYQLSSYFVDTTLGGHGTGVKSCVFLGVLAGLLALAVDVPASAALAAAVAGGIFWLFLLQHPRAWIPLFLALALLLPPFPVIFAGQEVPVHPASLLFALAVPVMMIRGSGCQLRPRPAGWWNRDSLSLSFLLFLAVLLFSTGLSFLYSGTGLGFESLLRWLLLTQGFAAFAWISYGPEGEVPSESAVVKLLLVLALGSAVFALVDFIYQFLPTVRFSEQYIYLLEGPRRRAQGVFYDAGALGNFCALLLTLIASLGLGEGTRRLGVSRALVWLPAPALAVALVVSFSRGAILNLVAAFAALAWLHGRRLLGWRTVAVTAGAAGSALLAAGLLVAGLAPNITQPFFLRLEFSALQFFASPNEVLSRRLETWRFLLSFIAERPQHFLLGIGYKTLPYVSFFGRPLVADNMYLSLLAETGVLGLVAFLLLSLLLLLRTYRMSRSSDFVLATLGAFLFAGWLGEMVQMLSSDTLTYWRVTPVYFVLLGLAVRRARRFPLEDEREDHAQHQ